MRMPSKRNQIIVLILLAFIFSTSIAVVNRRITIRDPAIYHGDAKTYHANAVSFLHGGDFDADTTFQRKPPMYSLFMAMGYSLFGERSLSTWILQEILHVVTVLLLFTIARSLFTEKQAFVATLVYTIFWGSAFWVYKIGPETLSTFFVVALLYIMMKYRAKNDVRFVMGFGVLLAALILTKPVVMFVVPFLLFFLRTEKKPFRKAHVAIALGIVVVIVGGWMLRNSLRYGSFEIEQSGQIIWSRSILAAEPTHNIVAYGIAAMCGDYMTNYLIPGYSSHPVPTEVNNRMKEFSREYKKIDPDSGSLDEAFRKEGIPRLFRNMGGFVISSIPSLIELNGPVTHQGKSITHFLADNDVKIENSHYVKVLRSVVGYDGDISSALKIATTLAIRLVWFVVMLMVLYGVLLGLRSGGVWWPIVFLVGYFNVMHALIVIPIEVRFIAPVWPLYVLLGVLGGGAIRARYSTHVPRASESQPQNITTSTMEKDIIIIPTYNERDNIHALIKEIFRVVPRVSIMVVDDNSPDGTAEIVRELMRSFPQLSLLSRKGKEGLGKAYIHAFQKALEDGAVRSVVMMDADFSHSPKYLPEMFSQARLYDVVIGSRYTKGGLTEGWERWRKVLSFGGNLYCRTITRMPMKDCTGGFNIIHASLLRKIDLSHIDMSGYAFIMELKYALYKAGASFKEVPIVFKNRTGGESKITNHIISEGVLAPWKMIFKRS